MYECVHNISEKSQTVTALQRKCQGTLMIETHFIHFCNQGTADTEFLLQCQPLYSFGFTLF